MFLQNFRKTIIVHTNHLNFQWKDKLFCFLVPRKYRLLAELDSTSAFVTELLYSTRDVN